MSARCTCDWDLPMGNITASPRCPNPEHRRIAEEDRLKREEWLREHERRRQEANREQHMMQHLSWLLTAPEPEPRPFLRYLAVAAAAATTAFIVARKIG